MSDEKTYNGWRNAATWRVQLHLSNDEWEADFVTAAARQYLRPGHRPAVVPPSQQPETFRDFLPAYVQSKILPWEPAEDTWEQLKNDWVQAALSEVDWDEIAEHWLAVARHEIASGQSGRRPTATLEFLKNEVQE